MLCVVAFFLSTKASVSYRHYCLNFSARRRTSENALLRYFIYRLWRRRSLLRPLLYMKYFLNLFEFSLPTQPIFIRPAPAAQRYCNPASAGPLNQPRLDEKGPVRSPALLCAPRLHTACTPLPRNRVRNNRLDSQVLKLTSEALPQVALRQHLYF